ncbi:hypothetical protein [Pseudomonas aeruginosa]|uniref:hypothetical protein n=1 Tax=Pseudomonas aeruginosa TaxID=287 RepID=UPI0020439B77|nr:hypothetical protein [Pseudomonas aeruginosa]MCM3970315.1 hypothetical protein [Pseudomonas aeruginosa]MCM4036966.1 hypothetical protein [Pseudomonas aeruginosa]MCM4054665.1 hypothetical protein [Pseudomonas aeruginosa]
MRKFSRAPIIELKAYWKARRATKNISLQIKSRKFLTTESIKNAKQKYGTLQQILKQTQWSILATAFVAIALQYIDHYSAPIFHRIGMKVPDDTDYITFLSAIAGIGGVFIGLYYAALSAVGSAIYAKVPNNIRELLAQERYGSIYMRLLSFITLLCIMLITLRIIGQPRIITAIPLVTILAGIGVIAFVKLGQRAFNLFDPTSLSHHIFEDLSKWIGIIRAGGYQWADPSFQKHAYKNSVTAIETLLVLFDIAAKEPHQNGRPLVNLSARTISFLIHYNKLKSQIPSESLWYQEKYKHKDWYSTSDIFTSIAHRSGTALQPETVQDKFWLENRIQPELIRCFKINLYEGRFSEAASTLNNLLNYATSLARHGQTARAIELTEKISEEFTKSLTSDNKTNKLKEIEELSIAESIAALPISIILAQRDLTISTNIEIIQSKLNNIDWDDKKTIYQKELPVYLIPQLEWLQTRLEFEKLIEDHRITPNWYQLELVCLADINALHESAEILTKRAKIFYEDTISRYKNLKKNWLAAATLSREWEYWHKTAFTADSWQKKWSAISSQQKLKDLAWPKFETSAIKSDINSRQEGILREMAEQNILLSIDDRPDEYPDYAGQFLHITGELIINALIENNSVLATSLFEKYIYGCFLRFDRLRPKSGTDWRIENEFKIAAAAIIDLIEISGYAKLLAEFHNNPDLWNKIEGSWNNICSKESGIQADFILRIIIKTAGGGRFEIPHRSLLRTSWSQQISHLLGTLPRKHSNRRRALFGESEADHPSRLVQTMAKESYGSFNSGFDIFVVYYFLNKKNIDDFEPSWQQNELLKSIKQETNNNDEEERGA